MIRVDNRRRPILIETFLFLMGLVIFSYFPHNTVYCFICSTFGLLIIIFIISSKINSFRDFQNLFDICIQSRNIIYYVVIGSLVGLLFGIIYRDYLKIAILPYRLTYFAIIASVIGATEELLFRGFLQKQLRQVGIMLSIIFASLFHTIYKSVFFLSRHTYFEINFLFLIEWTFLVGIIFGIIKEYSKNSLSPVSGHAMFDIIVYGDGSIIPWWIWT
ncbi:MAG: CPBP family intramembrane glutamic endopeptidase [Thermodesulfobacteriota bacterium]|nr:CPBP family intramembrane glutamic endopeptidase [Thermodesulfobacteriota bacterium]